MYLSSISPVASRFSLRLCLTLLLLAVSRQVHADEITISGDSTILNNTEATFYVTLHRNYPSIFFFGYEFHINLPNPVNVEVLSNTLAKFTHTFENVTSGQYSMTVDVYIYFFQQKAWKVGEATQLLKVTDNLGDFFKISGKQSGLPPYTPNNIFVPDKLVDFSADLTVPSSVLSSNSTRIDYSWTLSGPNATTITTHQNPKFAHNFTVGNYALTLDIVANITTNQNAVLTKQGSIKQVLFIKAPITNANISGNNFVLNGSLLHLNVSCNGSSNFMICHYFSDSKSNNSCFNDATVLDNCFQEISHYFPRNGSQYINIGIRNDVSEAWQHSKITIYKVGPTRSLLFVILPLVSSFLVILIILSGVAHYVKLRRQLDAGVETATMESFGLGYGQNRSLTEITFFKRIGLSIQGLFRASP